MKVTLNIVLDLGCEDEIIDMINGFIDRKKSSIKDEDEGVLYVSDPVI